MDILGIETSCDETAAAVVRDGREVLSNVVYTQIPLHQPYGGVVPEIASRAHVEKISQVVGEALKGRKIDAVAVTYGPGLSPALIVGLNAAKGLAKALKAAGKTPIAILGFNKSEEIFYADEFKALGVETFITTVDGSTGIKGFVTDALPAEYDYFCTCGPLPMLKAIYNSTKTSGLLSFEERMGCGFGACMGCSCKTKYGNKRICKDGPVLEKEEIVW